VIPLRQKGEAVSKGRPQMTIRLDPEVHARLEGFARTLGVTRVEVVRALLEEFVPLMDDLEEVYLEARRVTSQVQREALVDGWAKRQMYRLQAMVEGGEELEHTQGQRPKEA
jgi:predicted DNA-binding protein